MSNETVVNCINSINNLSASETRILRTTSRSEICPLTTVRVVTGDVDMLSMPGRGIVRVQSGSPGTQTLFLFMPDIIGESCDGDTEMESGGEVGTLVTRHAVAPAYQAPGS